MLKRVLLFSSLAILATFTVIGVTGANGDISDLADRGISFYRGFPGFSAIGLQQTAIVDYTTTSSSRTVLRKETGKVFTDSESSDDPVTFVLPACEKGLIYTFIDLDATAAADLTIDTQTGDAINHQTAGVTYVATGDAVGESVTLLGIDSTNWVVISKIGTWTTGS